MDQQGSSDTEVKQGSCAICGKAKAGYCCPRCATKTCSLICCKQHKFDTGCNGKRDRTQFCSLAKFTDRQLASDYHFLEDVLKCGDRAGRFVREEMGGLGKPGAGRKRAHPGTAQESGATISPLLLSHAEEEKMLRDSQDKERREGKSWGGVRPSVKRFDPLPLSPVPPAIATVKESPRRLLHVNDPEWLAKHPPHLRRLVRSAHERNITLLLMPPGMARRKENTTTCNPKTNILRWKLELKFHVSSSSSKSANLLSKTKENEIEDSSVSISVNGIQESTKLSDLIAAQLDVVPGGKNREARSKLKSLAAIPRDMVRIITKVLPCPASSPKYTVLCANQTLAEALKGRTIVEYPILEVVRESDLRDFPMMIEELPGMEIGNQTVGT